jgi:hypothetical protein
MSRVGNGAGPANGKNNNGKAPAPAPTPRCPRRIVLLADDAQSEAAEVLLEMCGDEISGNRLHTEVQRLAGDHRGKVIAAEWLNSLGWTRFLWCRK